jgi:glycosyltransferase involved in cell wall biosynthesis
MGEAPPTVSIVLPTFNRARFLPAAFEAIRNQTSHDWELIIVDDGSIDDTRQVVDGLRRRIAQPIHYIWQPNAGAYAARNRALELATAPYVAFFDSDDVWLSHHLTNCIRALDDNPAIDWVYGACRTVDYASGRVLAPTTFAIDGTPRPFRRLAVDVRGPLHVLTNGGIVECALLHGLYCGLQNSVFRRRVFDDNLFQAADRNEAEDQLFVIRTLKRGHRIAYLNDVHVQYHVHETNSSGSATSERSVERQRALFEPVARGLEQLPQQIPLTRTERRALRKRLNREYFWHLGYAVFWSNRRHIDAVRAFHRGLREWPWSVRCWKTYAIARMRIALNKGGS